VQHAGRDNLGSDTFAPALSTRRTGTRACRRWSTSTVKEPR